MNNVTFKYENQETPVLNRISFNVYQGERIAIIGPSGSGKSTLLQVMLGLYQVQEGSVIYKQSDIFRIEDESKYSDINALLQSQQLFDGTIKDNLLTDCNEDKIQHVL
ncbi:ATP-binding cassette domain-containing protein, partial [Staphylococcus pasteuri]|uniref:ATP-binding cassette domain-containing protein n=1 Tax=Staphylococcus pasteuri TaxID=45972 RepID=UPI0030EC72F5